MKRERSTPAVPTVAFYGDVAQWSTSALVHSEPLIERSRLHAWKIRPHRHSSLAQLFWLARGSGSGRFDGGKPYELDAPCVVVVPELCVHEFEWRQDCDGFALSIASALAHDLKVRVGSSTALFGAPRVLSAGDDRAYVGALFSRLQDEYASTRPLKESALENLIEGLAIWVARRTPAARTAEHSSRASSHFERFTQLIERRHRSVSTVAAYAHELGITPAHLNAICRDLGGRSALRMIHDRVLLAARRELTYTDKSIADVAASLGFSEASYFTRFFKQKMRMTPKQYRRSSGTLAGNGSSG